MDVVASSWLLYFQWAYAVWQFIRNGPLVTLLVRLPFWMLFYRSRKKRVFLLNEVYEDWRQDHDVGCFQPGDKKNDVEIVAREGYWVKAKFNDDYIIIHQNQIAKIWFTDFSDDFVINKFDITDTVSVATKLSAREALLKIAGTFKTTEVKSTCIYCPQFGIALNSRFAGVVSTIPLFAQAKGFPIVSAWLSLAILIMDVLRTPLYRIYDSGFDYLSAMVKLHVFKKRTRLYLFFSIFSERWSYGDKSKKYVYNGKDCGFLVHTIAVFKNVGDYELTFGYGDYESSYPSPEDQHFIISKNKIYALPILPRMGSYCKVMCRIDSIVTGKPSASRNLYTQPLF